MVRVFLYALILLGWGVKRGASCDPVSVRLRRASVPAIIS